MRENMKAKRSGRGRTAVICAAFLLLGAVFAVTGIMLFPIYKSSRQNSAEALPFRRPVIWYSDTGLFAYDPGTKTNRKLTDLKNGGTDLLTRLYTEENPADSTSAAADGRTFFFMKDLTSDYLTGTLGDLYRTILPGSGKKGKEGKNGMKAGLEEQIAAGIIRYTLTGNNGVLWLDADENLYFLPDAGAPAGDAVRLFSGAVEYLVSGDGTALFFLSDSGGGWTADLRTGGPCRKIADGIREIAYASEDLSVIYYAASGGAYSAMSDDYYEGSGLDLFYIADLGTPRIVDVDITQYSVIRHTGHLYYLKEEAELTPEERERAEDRVQELIGQLTGAETAEEPEDGVETAEEPEDRAETAMEPEDAGAAEEYAEDGGTYAEETDDPGIGETSGTLYFFDGSGHHEVTKHVAYLDDSHSDDIQKDRITVRLNAAGGLRIELAAGEKALDTGLDALRDDLTDYCPDLTEDVFYFGRKKDGADDASDGTVCSMPYTEDGFGPEKELFDGASVIPAACAGRVFTGKRGADGDSFSFCVNGVPIADRVRSYFWDETGEREDIQILKNVFEESYAVAGELDHWSGVTGEEPVPVVYGVREYHAFDDGSFTCLTDYDEEQRCGTLVYWDRVNAPEVISENAVGTKKGLGEEE